MPRFTKILFLSVVVAGCLLQPERNAVAQPPPRSNQPPAETFLPSYLRERMARRISARRDNSQMNALVRPLTNSIGRSTVEVFSDTQRVALGAIVSGNGLIITKASELQPDAQIRARSSDNRIHRAELLATLRSVDLALLKIDAVDLAPIRLSDSTPPVGSFVVSADSSGEPIGIGAVSVEPREVQDRGLLGVSLVNDSQRSGARVAWVMPESGADNAGISEGDLIVAVNGATVATNHEATAQLRAMYPGDIVELSVVRDDKQRTVKAEIQEYASFLESDDDTRVNGPRSSRLTGFVIAMQHDTVLGPDQCGGPLIDTSGNVIGINIARSGRVCSYAIPAAAVAAAIRRMVADSGASETQQQRVPVSTR